jgi:predicted O-methyltransferase YrrM
MSDLESRFTPVSNFCAHPEYWHSPDEHATEDEVTEFVGSLVRLIQPEFVLETGSYIGHTTIEMSRALYMNGHGRGISLEWDPVLAETAQRNLNNALGENNRFAVINIDSRLYEPVEDIDFAFFDSHQELRGEEFLRFHGMGRLKPGTIVAFHDTAPHHQIMKHIQPLEDEGYFKLITFHTPRGISVGQVLK